MSTTIIFGTLQKIMSMDCWNIFPTGDLVLFQSRGFSIFKEGYQNNCYQIVKRQNTANIRKGEKFASFKKISEAI